MPTVTQPKPSQSDAGSNPESQPPAPLRIRYRIRFAKTGLLRWISHRDLAMLWQRLLRRAQLKLSMTEGFHPKPRVGFPSALALGVESLDEVVEIELAEERDPAALLKLLRDDNQPGLEILRVSQLPERFGKGQLSRGDYTIGIVEDADPEAIQDAMATLLARETVSVERKKKTMTVTVASQIARLELGEGVIHLSLTASDGATLKPTDVLDLLGFGDWIERGSLITRVKVNLHRELLPEDGAIEAVAPETSPSPEDPTPTS